MTEAERAKYEQAVLETATYLRVADVFLNEALEPPSPESAMGKARAAKLRDAYELAALLAFAGDDHLNTILQVLETGTVPTYALYSLLRPAAEAAALISYLLEPADETTRLARALNLRLDNLLEQDKFLHGEFELAASVARLEQRATAHGIVVVTHTNAAGVRKVKGFGELLPDVTTLFRRYLGAGETMYRYLSGHSHVMSWVMVDRSHATPTEDPEVASVELHFSMEAFGDALAIVLHACERNALRRLELAGFRADLYRQAKSTATTVAKDRLKAIAKRLATPVPVGD